jgi:hypothetical protein
LRRQATAAMVFNGHTEKSVNEISEEVFTEIQVMYADGMLGNRAIFDGIAPMTTAVFNYMRGENVAPYKQASLFPWINEYWQNPDYEPTPEEKVNNALLSFVSQAKGFDKGRFKQ